MEYTLRPFWNRFFDFNWKFGLFLIITICIPRFLLGLNTNESGDYEYISVLLAISAVAPFLFLNKQGRKSIGISKPLDYTTVGFAFIFGLSVSVLLHTLGLLLYPTLYENWSTYTGNLYAIPIQINPRDKADILSTMALAVITISPIGEEMFFRGMIYSSFAKSLGSNNASIVGSVAFALTHISHFGLVFIDYQSSFLTVPVILCLLCLFLVSMLFHAFKKFSGSLLGAIICHLAFNFGMIYWIFFLM